jgi:CoA:oxalate CoA-transferase
MERLGLGYETLKDVNQRLVYAAGTGFGQTGPYRGRPAFDITTLAAAGILSLTGEEGGPPIRPGVSYGDISAGLFLCIAVLAALQERHSSGLGQLIDISMLDSQLTVAENAFARYLNTGDVARATGRRHPLFTPFQVFGTKDGYIAVAIKGGADDQWPLFCALIGRVELIDDARYADGWSRTEHYSELGPLMEGVFRSRTTVEWLADLESAGIACSRVNDVAQAAADPQVAARDMILDVEQPGSGTFQVVDSPFKFSRSRSGGGGHAPELGENTGEVFQSLLGLAGDRLEDLKRDGVI